MWLQKPYCNPRSREITLLTKNALCLQESHDHFHTATSVSCLWPPHPPTHHITTPPALCNSVLLEILRTSLCSKFLPSAELKALTRRMSRLICVADPESGASVAVGTKSQTRHRAALEYITSTVSHLRLSINPTWTEVAPLFLWISRRRPLALPPRVLSVMSLLSHLIAFQT